MNKNTGTNAAADAAIALVSTVSDKTKRELAPSVSSLVKSELSKPSTKGEREMLKSISGVQTLVVKGKAEIGPGPVQQLPPASRELSHVSREDVVSLIEGVRYGIVKPKVGDMRDSFLMHSMYYLALLGAGVATALVPSTVAAIGALSMGTLGVSANFKNFQDSADKYLNDRRKLIESFEMIDLLRGNDNSFPGGVQQAYDSVMKYLQAMESTDGSPSK